MPQIYVVSTGSVALVAATAKTVIGLATLSTQDAQVVKIRFSFDGSVATGNNVKVELLTWTADGTGTSITPFLYGENQNKAALTTAKGNYSAEPTSITVRDMFWLPPNIAPYAEYDPLGQELEMPESKFYGFRLTSPSANNVAITAFVKE
jgi:hypothetical protein